MSPPLDLNETLTGGQTETFSGDFNGDTITLSGDGTFDFSHDANDATVVVLDAGVTVNIAHDFNGGTFIGDTIRNSVADSDIAAIVHDANGAILSDGTLLYGHDANGAMITGGTSLHELGTGIINIGHDANGAVFNFLPAPCFAAGTRILTTRGEVAVEDLRIGDLVVTLSGKGSPLKPVRWIGERKIDLAAHPRPDLVRPVRITAGTFGNGSPQRDLVVSPDHALCVDGVLVNAGKLLNGVSIAQDRSTSAVHYFHVELDRHDVLIAEGMPAESYLDTGNRGQFAKAARLVVLHPDFAPKRIQTDACLPFIEDGPVLVSVRARLIGALAAQGCTVTDEPELGLLVNGRLLPPSVVAGQTYRFALPERVSEARIVSRTGVPSGTVLGVTDGRRLGVCLAGINLERAGRVTPIPLDHPALCEGLHALERNAEAAWRWTDGDAHLPAAVLGDADGAVLELRLLWPGAYWIMPEQPGLSRATA